jgi:hypothetical protein
MTKKHYQLLASIIHNHVAAEQLAGSKLGREYELVLALGNAMRKDNERFSRVRFMEACGL